MRQTTHPPATNEKNAPQMLKRSVMSRTWRQLAARETSLAPTANPIRPMISARQNAASAPTQTALHATGHDFDPVSYWSICSLLARGAIRSLLLGYFSVRT